MTVSEIIMAALAFASLMMVVLAWRRTQRRDTTTNAAQDQQQRTDMQYLIRGVDDIRVDIRAMRNEISDVDRRVVAINESVKSAHKRIDEHLQEHRELHHQPHE
ncbi:MAG: hypothetical protein IKK21_05080 [Clostridia bacterium]|nr:hypothetical protein [Clostridia bacterium]